MKKQCKNCESSVEYLNIDYDSGAIRCFYCSHTLPAEMFFNDLTVNKFAKKIPEIRRDEFMEKLGFERKSIKKSTIIIGFFAALVPIITTLSKFLEKKDNIAELAFAAVPVLIVLVPVVINLLGVNSTKYVKKKAE